MPSSVATCSTSDRPSATTLSVTDWCKVFIALGTENYASSVAFMKQLTMIAMSTISYLRGAFPADCFTCEPFAGLDVYVLKETCSDSLAQFVSTSLRLAFDALEKKYIYQLVMCFYEGERLPKNLTEYYLFEYSYSEEGVFMNMKSKRPGQPQQTVKCTFESIKAQTQFLVRQCFVMMGALSDTGLTSSTDIVMRIYYNHDAPDEYQAPGFFEDNSEDHLLHTLSEAVTVGRVTTPYHKVVARSYAQNFIQESNEALPSQNTPMMSLSALPSPSSTSREMQLECPCNKDEDVGTYAPPLLIRCTYCGTMQHAACFGILAERVSSLKAHCCLRCSDADASRRPTDEKLSGLTARKRESYCMYRRTLECCRQLAELSASHLIDRFCMSLSNAARVMNVLHSNGIVGLPKEDDITTPLAINREALESTILRVFRVDGEISLADRLLVETLGSQESQHSQPDPVSDVLSAREKMALQQASHRGRVIPAAAGPVQTDDEIMKQYRDVMARQPSVVLEELPLSGLSVAKDTEEVKGKRKINDSLELKLTISASDPWLPQGVDEGSHGSDADYL